MPETWGAFFSQLFLVGGGVVTIELLRYFREASKGILGKKRSELKRLGDQLVMVTADAEKYKRLYRSAIEDVYTLRLMMIKSGNWTEENLPEPPEEL